ncbi:MAG: hypothetical protein O3B01_22295 [Planctomycetota bacterium]|nr:hypothetical protein [Planctomycetota bacterium]MDA1141302.1 hypothetical protein [Planctomycetota bacterium]
MWESASVTNFRARIAGLVLLAFIASEALFCSGTSRPPNAPGRISSIIPKGRIDRGKVLFNDTGLFRQSGKSCMTCHDSGGQNSFTRSSLQKNAKDLSDRIQHIGDSSGPTLDLESEDLKSLAAYLIARYRLPREALESVQ